jgi:hypothetical protein
MKSHEVLKQAIANEGRIDENEFGQIRHQWRQLQSQGEAFVRACESGAFDPRRRHERTTLARE